MQSLHRFTNINFAKKFLLMRKLKCQLKISVKLFSETTDLRAPTQTLCVKEVSADIFVFIYFKKPPKYLFYTHLFPQIRQKYFISV